jgi:uncharacterized protein
MDVSPTVPEGKQLVEGYGDGRFRIAGEVYEGSVIVFPDRTVTWPVAAFADMTVESLQPVTQGDDDIDLLLLGCGEKMQLVTKAFRQPVRDAGVVIEPMDTGAACRTFNVLMAEERRVAAALIAV